MNKLKVIHVVAAIIRRGNEIFATQRGYGDYKDWWEFPGGKAEAGETSEEALIREIKEELATDITVDKYITTVNYDYPEFHLTMECFWCSVKNGELILLEHEAAKWLPLNDLRQVNWLPADLEVIEMIEREEIVQTSDFPRKIAKEWFETGKNREAVFKFVAYWIAFNQLYNYGIRNLDSLSERERIKRYCDKHISVLKQTLDFSKLDLEEFYSKPVIPGSRSVEDIGENDSFADITEKIFKEIADRRPPKKNATKEEIMQYRENTAKDIAREFINIRDLSGKEKILSLFSEIYTVRCNLFHGSKTPSPNRDYYLVKESAAALEMCLEALIVDTFKD